MTEVNGTGNGDTNKQQFSEGDNSSGETLVNLKHFSHLCSIFIFLKKKTLGLNSLLIAGVHSDEGHSPGEGKPAPKKAGRKPLTTEPTNKRKVFRCRSGSLSLPSLDHKRALSLLTEL